MNTCASCRFFNVVYGHQIRTGQCRRHAPVLGGEFGITAWPKVEPEFWCGDFQYSLQAEPCKTCGEPVGDFRGCNPTLKTALAQSYTYPTCKKCHDQFLAGTHPFQQLTCKHEYVNSDRNLKTYTCAQCGASLDENRRALA